VRNVRGVAAATTTDADAAVRCTRRGRQADLTADLAGRILARANIDVRQTRKQVDQLRLSERRLPRRRRATRTTNPNEPRANRARDTHMNHGSRRPARKTPKSQPPSQHIPVQTGRELPRRPDRRPNRRWHLLRSCQVRSEMSHTSRGRRRHRCRRPRAPRAGRAAAGTRKMRRVRSVRDVRAMRRVTKHRSRTLQRPAQCEQRLGKPPRQITRIRTIGRQLRPIRMSNRPFRRKRSQRHTHRKEKRSSAPHTRKVTRTLPTVNDPGDLSPAGQGPARRKVNRASARGHGYLQRLTETLRTGCSSITFGATPRWP
jgi:hypothetical protein